MRGELLLQTIALLKYTPGVCMSVKERRQNQNGAWLAMQWAGLRHHLFPSVPSQVTHKPADSRLKSNLKCSNQHTSLDPLVFVYSMLSVWERKLCYSCKGAFLVLWSGVRLAFPLLSRAPACPWPDSASACCLFLSYIGTFEWMGH